MRTSITLFILMMCSISYGQNDIEVIFRTGHINAIVNSSISPDSRMLATVDKDNLIVVWDLRTRQQLYTINGADDEISIIMFSHTGQYLIGAGSNIDGFANEILGLAKSQHIRFWDAYSGAEVHRTPLDKQIYFMDYTTDGQIVTFEAGTIGSQMYYRNPTSGERLAKQKISGILPAPENYAISPDGKLLAIASKGGASKGKTLLKQIVKDLIDEDSKETEKKGYVLLQNLENDKLLSNIYISFSESALIEKNTRAMKFTPDGRYLVLAGQFKEGNLKVIDVENQKLIKSIRTTHPIDGMDFSKDNKYCYTTTANLNEILKWNIDNWLISDKITTGNAISQLLFSPDGQYFVTVGGNPELKISELKLWDYKTQKQIGTFEEMIPFINDAIFNGQQLTVATNDGHVQIIDMCNTELINTLHVGKGETHVGLSADKKYLVASSIDKSKIQLDGMKMLSPQVSKIYENESFEVVKTIPDYAQTMVSPSGDSYLAVKWLAIRSEVALLDMQTGATISSNKILGNQDFYGFSPDGQYFMGTKAGLVGQNIAVWDIQEMKSKFKAKKYANKAGQDVTSMKFSPDGSKITVGIGQMEKYNYGLLRDWNFPSGEPGHTYLAIDSGAVFSSAYNPDGSLLVCGVVYENRSNKFIVFDTKTGNIKETVENKGLPFAFSDDGKYLLAYGSLTMKELFVIDMTTMQIKVRYLKINNQDDCILITNDNYYKITPNAYKAVSFRRENKLYPFEQFDLIYNRPDIVAANLPYSDSTIVDYYKKVYTKRLRKMGLSEATLDRSFHFPELAVTNALDLPISTSNKTIDLNINALDSKYNLAQLNVWVNDVPLLGTRGIPLYEQNISNYSKTIPIVLSSGENKIQVSVVNEKGIESEKFTHYITCTARPLSNDLYILAIGVSDYDDNDFDLDYAVKDARDMVKLFAGQQGKYDNIYVKTILDKQATSANIKAAKTFLNKTTVDDQVILFISGHGLLDPDLNYYYATCNVDFYNPANNGLPFDEVENLLDGIPARKKIMFVDACHSGEVDKESMITGDDEVVAEGTVKHKGFKPIVDKNTKNKVGLKNSFELMKEMFADLRRGSGATIISSAGGAEFAFESSEWENGVFSYSVIEGIKTRKADADQNNEITVSEIRKYVADRVRQLTNGKQTPTFRSENLEFDYQIW